MGLNRQLAAGAAVLAVAAAIPQAPNFAAIDAAPTVANGPPAVVQPNGVQSASLYTSFTVTGPTAAASKASKRAAKANIRAAFASSVTDSGYDSSFGSLSQLTTVNRGVDYWINGGSTHNFFGNLNNAGRIVVSQTSYLQQNPYAGGQTCDFVGHDANNGNLVNAQGALIQLNDYGSASAPTYDWYLHAMNNSGTMQFCGRGDTGGSTYQLYSDLDAVNNGLISFEQYNNNYGASFVWRNPTLTTVNTGYNLYNNGAFRIINVVYHNVQNVYGNGCWEIGAGGVLYLEDGTGVFQNPNAGPSFPNQNIIFQDSTSVLHMDTAVYSRNSNFGPQIYNFARGNAIEFYQLISTFGYSASTGILNIAFIGGYQVNIKLGTGYTPTSFAKRLNPQKYNVVGYNAIFYDGAAPAQNVPSQCAITAPVCSGLAGGLPPWWGTTATSSVPATTSSAVTTSSSIGLPVTVPTTSSISLPVSIPTTPSISIPVSVPTSISVPVSIPTTPSISIPVSVPTSVSIPVSIPTSVSLPVSIPTSISIPVSVPTSVSIPVLTSVSIPVSIPTGVSIPVSIPTSVSIPVSIPTSVSIPVSIPTSVSIPVSVPTSVSIPVSIPTTLSISVPVSVPTSISIPISIPTTLSISVPVSVPTSLTISVPVSIPTTLSISVPVSVPTSVSIPLSLPTSVSIPVSIPTTPSVSIPNTLPSTLSTSISLPISIPTSSSISIPVTTPSSSSTRTSISTPITSTLIPTQTVTRTCPASSYSPYYPALSNGYTTDPALTATTTANQPCPTTPEAGTYCGFINPLDPCSPQPDGYGPVPQPDTASAFSAYPSFHALASAAPSVIPSNLQSTQYTQVFRDLNGSVSANSYLGLHVLKSYSPSQCASLCDCTDLCSSFNLYIERDPSLNPSANDSSAPTVWGYDCPNPASMTSFKCTLWGSAISASDATNHGQYRESFQVVVAGSDGWVAGSTGSIIRTPDKISRCSAPVNLNGKALDNPGQFLGSRFFPGPFNPSVCGVFAFEQRDRNVKSGFSAGVGTINAYYLNRNGKPHGTYCGLYSAGVGAKYATWRKGTNAGVVFEVVQSWSYSVVA